MKNKQIFSIRKTALGVGSVLLGTMLFLTDSTTAHAKEVNKKFNDIIETVEVIGENRSLSVEDMSSLTEGNSIYLLVEENDLNDDNNSETEYERFIKITPTSEELAKGIKYPDEYIMNKYKKNIDNLTILTKEEIEKQGGFKENDLIITGTGEELLASTNFNVDKMYENMDKIKLPYIYYPEKSIAWNPSGTSELTYDSFADKLDIVPVDSSIVKNESIIVKDELLNYNVNADSFTFNTTIDGKKFTYTGNSTTLHRNFSLSKIYEHENGSLKVNYMFHYNPNSKNVEYVGKNSMLYPKGKEGIETPTHSYNVGIAMKTDDGRVTTQLAQVFSPDGFYNRKSQNGTITTNAYVPYMRSYKGWGEILLAYDARLTSVFKDSSSTPGDTGIYGDYDDPKYGKVYVVWKDGKEPVPLKPGEKLTKEYKLYFNGKFRLDNRTNYAVTDWKTITFVGDTTQYDSADDFKELDAKETDKLGKGEHFRSWFDYYKDKDSYGEELEMYYSNDIDRNPDMLNKRLSDNDYSVDGTHREFYEERKKDNFETNSDNLVGYDGTSWDLVPTYYDYGGDTLGGYLFSRAMTSFSFIYSPDGSPATYNTYRVLKKANSSVVIAYENELGEVIKDEETLIDNQPIGTKYTSDPSDTIVGNDGKTYYKVKLKDGSQPATGDVTKETKKVTWVYRLPEITEVKGNVVVKYVDTEDSELLSEYNTDEKVVTTVVNRFTADGEKQLVSTTPSNETYNVEDRKHPKITDQNIVYNFKEVKDAKPLTGTLTNGETVITLVYEKTPTETREEMGHIKVIYTDEKGREIESAIVKPDETVNRIVEQPMVDGTKTVISTTPTNATYDVNADKKERIEFEGKVYKFKQVKDVQPTGTLAVGETVVTYVYEVVKSNVEVKYITPEGEEIPDTDGADFEDEYTLIEEKQGPDGNTIRVMHKITTSYIDEKGNTIEKINKKVPNHKKIPNYTYITTETLSNGDIIHKYSKNPTIVYTDEEGEILTPENALDINKYTPVRENVDKDKNIITKVYHKITTTYKDDTGKVIETTDGKEIAPKVINVYTYTNTTVEEDGDVVHTYSKIPNNPTITYVNKDGENIPKVDAENPNKYIVISEKDKGNGNIERTVHKIVTKYVDNKTGNTIEEIEGKITEHKEIAGHTYITTELLDNGDVIHKYNKVPTITYIDEEENPVDKINAEDPNKYVVISEKEKENGDIEKIVHKIVTNYVDEDNKVFETVDGKVIEYKDIEGYTYITTETLSNGDIVHKYNKVKEEVDVNTDILDKNNKSKENETETNKEEVQTLKALPKTSTNSNSILYTGSLLVGLALLLKRKQRD